jgi:flagella basal body P-ring formation protein FlgA
MYASGHVRRTIRLAVLLALLAAAAHLLRPASVRGDEPVVERFVPSEARLYSGATLELRPEVSIIGEEVRLRSVCRWADSDKAAFDPIGELVLFRLSKAGPFRTLTVKELRQTLHEAGVNLAVVRLAGATSCTVARTDVKYDERTALEQWIAERESGATKPALIEGPSTQPSKTVVTEATAPREAQTAAAQTTRAVEEPKSFKTLRDGVVGEVSSRLNLPVEQLQLRFNPADQKLLNLSEPHFKFNVATPRNKNLGDVTWDVTIVADGVEGQGSQKATVTANVKAWQNQVIVHKPLGARQLIRAEDLVDRRSLVDRLPEDTLVTREQVVGQMAGRELKSGTLLTARLVEASILVKSGQLVSVMLTQGTIQAKTVAKAMEQGTMGQTIRVKNEVTGNIFDVVVTGPQTAKLPAAAGKGDVVSLDRN